MEKLNLRRLLKFLRSETWDVVVNTHFLPAEMIAALRRKGEVVTPQLTVTTDFETHRLWVNQPCDRYFTATEEGALNLQYWGVPAADIVVTGIPIHPAFGEPKDRAECQRRQGLTGGRPVLLQLAGGFGVGPIERLFESILRVETPVELVVVAGRNAELKTRLEQIAVPPRHLAHVFGFTTAMDELMAAADLVVSKPGGLTTSEALARHADGHRQSDSRPGEPQQRFPAGKRRGHQAEQRRHATLQAGSTVGRAGPAGPIDRQRQAARSPASGLRRGPSGARLADQRQLTNQ